MRAAVAQRHAKALRRTNGHVSAHGAGRLHEQRSQRVRTDAQLAAVCMQPIGQCREVAQAPLGVGALNMRAKHAGGVMGERIAHHDFHAHPARPRTHHRDHLRVHARIHQKDVRCMPGTATDDAKRFGSGGGFVQQRGIGHIKTGQVDDHLLKVEQGLQPALRHFSLIGCIRRIPARIFQHIAPDRLRGERAVIARANVAAPDLITLRDCGQFGQCIGLGDGGFNGERRITQDGCRNRVADQLTPRGIADRSEHACFLRIGGTDMAGVERIGIQQAAQSACL